MRPLTLPLPQRPLQIRRRCLTTSAAFRSQQSARPSPLSCSQLLFNENQSTTSGATSLDNQEIRVQGFIRSVRKQKRFAFAEITDGSTIRSVQAILTPDQAANLTTGAAVDISGLWQRCPAGKEQSHELQAREVNVVGEADPETYPIQKKYHSPDFLRQIPHLRLRTPFISLLSRFRSECIYQLGNVFHSWPNRSFIQVQPPLITSSDCEGAGEVFTVATREQLEKKGEAEEFFRSQTYLTVSSQLHLEAYAAELGNVWALSPTFRAERSDTPRHLSEFYMLEAEMNFLESLNELLDLTESLIRDLTERLYATRVASEILTAKRTGESGQEDTDHGLRQRWLALIEGEKWPRVTYAEAIKILENAVESKATTFSFPPSWTEGLQLEHEKYIVDVVGKGKPVFVTDYPKAVKPFYMAPSAGTPGTPGETVACFDLLMPEISEVVGGSMREHRLPSLIQNMRDHGLIKSYAPSAAAQDSSSADPASSSYPYLQPHESLGALRWYADLRRWGSAPHGGFGLGFDRFLGYLAGVSSIRDVVPFPRYHGRAEC